MEFRRVGEFGSRGVGGRHRLQPVRPPGGRRRRRAHRARGPGRRGHPLRHRRRLRRRRVERLLGAALRGRRDGAIVATKVGQQMGEGPYSTGASRRHIRAGVEASLRRLGSDWIDLYQIHVPDADTPIEETLSALDDLVREGKVRYIGCSNFSGWQIADADWTSYVHHFSRFVSAQNEYSLLNREAEAEVVPACEHFGLGLIPYFPLDARPADRPVPAGRGRPRGGEALRGGGRAVPHRRELRHRRGALRLRPAQGHRPPRGRHRGPAGPAGGGLGHRRGEPGRPGPGQRRGRRVEPSPEDLAELDEIAPPGHPVSE